MPMFSIATASTESAGREEKKRDAHDMRGCRLYIYERKICQKIALVVILR